MATDATYPPAAYALSLRRYDPDKRTPEQWAEALDYLLGYFTERVYYKVKNETVVRAGNLQELDRLLWTLKRAVMGIIEELGYYDRRSLHEVLDDLVFYHKLGSGINLRFTPLYVYDFSEHSVPTLDNVISINLYSFLFNSTFTGTRPIFHRLAEKIGMRAKTY